MVIKGATVFTCGEKGVIENCDIKIEQGKIVEIGHDINYDEHDVIDAAEMVVMPGLIDAHTHTGGLGIISQDLNEITNPCTPELDAIYGVDIEKYDFKQNVKSGITTCAIVPGSANVIGGTGFATKTAGNSLNDMCVKNPIALKVALGGNPKDFYGSKNKLPMTRMGIAEIIRETLRKGAAYRDEKNDKDVETPSYDHGLENIVKVLNKEIPLKVHCEQFDMLTIIKICEEFDVEFTIEHAWGASNYIEELSKCKNLKGICYGSIGVHLTPGECGIVDIYSVIDLEKNGVNCCLITDGPICSAETLLLHAGELVRFGMKVEDALKTITINPAKILGIDNMVGSIEVGKDADLAIFRGTPAFHTLAELVCTLVDGKIVYTQEK